VDVWGPIIQGQAALLCFSEWNREQPRITRATSYDRGRARGRFQRTAHRRLLLDGPIDPLTGAAFPAPDPDQPASPAGLLVLQLYPLPNTTPGPGSCNNW